MTLLMWFGRICGAYDWTKERQIVRFAVKRSLLYVVKLKSEKMKYYKVWILQNTELNAELLASFMFYPRHPRPIESIFHSWFNDRLQKGTQVGHLSAPWHYSVALFWKCTYKNLTHFPKDFYHMFRERHWKAKTTSGNFSMLVGGYQKPLREPKKTHFHTRMWNCRVGCY